MKSGEDMDALNDKISGLLENPEISGMIAALASGLVSGNREGSDHKQEPQDLPPTQPNSSAEDLTKALTAEDTTPPSLSGDNRIALLQAIKPYVSKSKRTRLDSLVRAIGVAGMLNSYAGRLPGMLFGKK